jgi:lipopolysaccharide/colanic/teichoic acid biosynthesis glycosyltransferase
MLQATNGVQPGGGVVSLWRSINGLGLDLQKQLFVGTDRGVLSEESFHRMISVERKRSERSGKPFLLMLLDAGSTQLSDQKSSVLAEIISTLSLSTREIDNTGWYKKSSVVGVIFPEIGTDNSLSVASTILTRVSATLGANLGPEQFNQISISFHCFPEDWDHETPQRPSNPAFYPDVVRNHSARKISRVVKRVMDIMGSALALVVLSPVFLAIALAIKLTSKGPILFRQARVGQHGIPFVFLKFRSMHAGNDTNIHRDYVLKLIAGNAEPRGSTGNGQGVYKLTKDSRVTSVGSFLRQTSLDELPQFLNVLLGEMSLVGPRPPIPYEVEAYDLWHRRRLWEAKPGITGLWQVNGRSRVKFDEMVRLDLRYAKNWSPWLDMKILMRTPWAVLLGDDAY